jgi:hypothetical protein
VEELANDGKFLIELPAQDARLLALYYQNPVPDVSDAALGMQATLSKKLQEAVAGRENDPSIKLMFDWIDPLDRASAVLLLAITQGLADHFLESADY